MLPAGEGFELPAPERMSLTGSHLLQLDPAAIGGMARKQPMLLDHDEPVNAPLRSRAPTGGHAVRIDEPAAPNTPRKHPMVLDDDEPVNAPLRTRAPTAGHSVRADPALGRGAPQDPALRRGAKGVPPPPPEAAIRRGAAGAPALPEAALRGRAGTPPAGAGLLGDVPPGRAAALARTAAELPLSAAGRFDLSNPPQRRQPATSLPSRAQSPLQPSAARHPALTLDRLSLPPTRMQRAAAAAAALSADAHVAQLYAQALGDVPELAQAPDAAANETRFSDAPPRLHSDVDLSDLELEVRTPLPEIENARAQQLSAATLAELPLFPLFAELPKDVLTEMVVSSDLIELPHGAYVLRRGDPGDALYGIVEGSVQVIVPGQDVRLTLGEGDLLGESALLQDEKRHADAIVHGKLVALRVPRGVLLRALERHPPLAELLFGLLTRRLVANLMQASPLFREFDAAARGEIARLFEIRRAPANTMLAVAGKRMDGLYLSLTGTLSLRQKNQRERIAPPGTMLGQDTLLTHAPSALDVQARVDMIVLRLPSGPFMSVAMQYPTILERLAELSTSEVVEVTI
jgi:CRP-like cAMP-binding protein